MKMQMREILILPAVDDQPIGGELEFSNKRLHDSEQVGKKSRSRVELHQAGNCPSGYEHHMKRIGWFRMIKRQQRIRLAQAPGRDGERHVGKNPTGDMGNRFMHYAIMFYKTHAA